MSKSSRIKDSVVQMDIFGYPILINFRGEQAYKTLFGGLLTVGIVILMAFFFIFQLSIMIARTELKTNLQSSYYTNPPGFTWTPNDFMFSILYADNTLQMNNSVFSFGVNYYSIITFDNGTSTTNLTTIPLRKCKRSDYEVMDLGAEYDFQHLDNALCPEFDQISISGDNISPFYQYIEIEATSCVNGSNPYIICQSPDAIQNYLDTLMYTRVRVLFSNHNVEPTNFANPISNFMDYVDVFASSGGLSIDSIAYFRAQTINTVSDYLGLSEGTNQTAVAFMKDREIRQYLPKVPTNRYLSLSLKAFNYVDVYYRTYMTLADVFGKVGGILNLVILFASLFAQYTNKVQWKFQLAKQYFPLKELEWDEEHSNWICRKPEFKTHRHSRRNISIDSLAALKEVKINETKIDGNDIELNDKTMYAHSKIGIDPDASTNIERTSRKENYIDKSDDVDKNQRDPPQKPKRFSLFSYLCFGKNYQHKSHIINRAFESMSKSLDVEQVLAKVQELDLLKKLVLNPSQLRVFELIKIHLIANQVISNDNWQRDERPVASTDLSKYHKDYLILKSEKSDCSKQILNMLDPTILAFFEDTSFDEGVEMELVKKPKNE